MQPERWRFRLTIILLILSSLLAVGIGGVTGYLLAETRNIQQRINIGEYTPALPSLILDRRGKLISQVYAEEKREIVSLDELPRHLIYALIAKEDRTFYRHKGFSVKGYVRAAWNILNDNYFSGGSTISQQVAGTLYEDREVETIGRKLKELFWSIQLEKRRTKDEILEIYLNFSSFGHGTFGVEAAAQFYFGHSAREISLAESAMLVTQLARINSMYRNPNRAKIVQKATLDAMAEMLLISSEEADSSYEEFWDSYDTTRSDVSSAQTEEHDEAPFFSELVRRQFETMFYGSSDLYRDGYKIHTTLDLSYQRLAVAEVARSKGRLNELYNENEKRALELARSRVLPVTELMSLVFSVDELGVNDKVRRGDAESLFARRLVDALNAVSLVHTDVGLQAVLDSYRSREERLVQKDTIEGALIAIENDTGYILSMVGEDTHGAANINLVTDSVMPLGSAVAPLYMWPAVERGDVMPSTLLYDSPAVFLSEIHRPFTPANYLDAWSGPVLARDAISRSINVASVKILEMTGLEAGLTGMASILGDPDGSGNRLRYPRKYSIGIGNFAVSPMDLTRAYAVFPRLGSGLVPYAIRHIEDRYGNIIYDNEQKILEELSKHKKIMSAQTAYLMTDMLMTTVSEGTLSRQVAEAGGFGGMPVAAKTGTTPTWSDAWVVGYSSFITTSVWFGFTVPGSSLGAYQTGAMAAGPAWVGFMQRVHEDLPIREFARPETGIIERRVCAVSGLLPTEVCTDGIREEIFLSGKEPRELCGYHEAKEKIDLYMQRKMAEQLRLFYIDDWVENDD